MGDDGAPTVGGGVDLKDYERGLKRTPGLVISTSSPDRCPAIFDIGSAFPGFFATYRQVPGMPKTTELSRAELVVVQQKAKALFYPLDPRRPSDFFSMSVLESLAAGTPVVVSDADAMKELWGDTAVVLPLPIRIGQWVETIEDLLCNKTRWNRLSLLGKKKAADFSWDRVAARYLKVATE